MYRYFCLFIISISLVSCVTNKDLEIFQTEKNTILKVYNHVNKISSGDLLYIEIKSLTPTKYDFFNKITPNSINSTNMNPYLLGYVVNDSGFVSLPTLGNLYLEDLTIVEAENSIKNLAKDYFVDPFVKIVQMNFNVTILGEVKKPGLLNVIDPNSTVIDIIGRAGGFTSLANRKKIKVVRTKGNNPMIFYVDLSNKFITNSNQFFVQNGDIISIEPLDKRFFVVNNISTALSVVFSALSLFILINNQTN